MIELMKLLTNNNMETYSQINQDLQVLKFLNNKTNGTFVDIGCGYPTFINNTYLLESKYGWKGISIDIEDMSDPIQSVNHGKNWPTIRPNSKHIIANALTIDYAVLFKDEGFDKIIDFLSLDLEPPSITLECLFKLPLNSFQFNFIAFETDEYRSDGNIRRDKSREYLTKHGYVFVGNLNRQDDFYVHSSIYNPKITF